MRYQYYCKEKTCERIGVVVEIEKSMKDAGRAEPCETCKSVLGRIYNSSGIKTGDGFKSGG